MMKIIGILLLVILLSILPFFIGHHTYIMFNIQDYNSNKGLVGILILMFISLSLIIFFLVIKAIINLKTILSTIADNKMIAIHTVFIVLFIFSVIYIALAVEASVWTLSLIVSLICIVSLLMNGLYINSRETSREIIYMAFKNESIID